jgi:sugar phosphate isomerase/epimerase
MDTCTASLDLAERIGARCAVNIAGSRGTKWDGPHPADLTEETFEMIVETVRAIIDTVQPRRTFYTIEPMPWMYPDSPESYLRLIGAVDREAFGVHLDPVNMINCPERYFRNDAFLRECFAKLGPLIKSCHIKDVSLDDQLTVHLSEVRPGLGALRSDVYLTELAALPGDIPLMLEHLPSPDEYTLAAAHIRQVAEAAGVEL